MMVLLVFIENIEPIIDEVTQENIEKEEFPSPIENSRELLKQPYLLDSEISVEQWLDMTDMKIHDFIRYQVGNYVE